MELFAMQIGVGLSLYCRSVSQCLWLKKQNMCETSITTWVYTKSAETHSSVDREIWFYWYLSLVCIHSGRIIVCVQRDFNEQTHWLEAVRLSKEEKSLFQLVCFKSSCQTAARLYYFFIMKISLNIFFCHQCRLVITLYPQTPTLAVTHSEKMQLAQSFHKWHKLITHSKHCC